MATSRDTSRYNAAIKFRATPRLEAQIADLARRDENSVSATIRRLITVGIRHEQREADRG
jgi:hypothetical protein